MQAKLQIWVTFWNPNFFHHRRNTGKPDKFNFSKMPYLTHYIHIICLSSYGLYQNYERAILPDFFMLSPPNLACTPHLWLISVQTNHISSAQEPHVASSLHIRWLEKKALSPNSIKKSKLYHLSYDGFSPFKSSSLKYEHLREIRQGTGIVLAGVSITVKG